MRMSSRVQSSVLTTCRAVRLRLKRPWRHHYSGMVNEERLHERKR